MPSFEIKYFRGGLSDSEDEGIRGAFKFASNLDIRKRVDSLTSTQALMDELGTLTEPSSSPSPSPSASASPSSPPSIYDDATLRGYWQFEETSGTNVDDSSTNGNDGTASRSNILNHTGGINGRKATFVASSSDKITLPDNTSIKPTGNFTIGAWIKTSSTGAFKAIFQSYSQNTNVAGFNLSIDNSNHLRLDSGKNSGTTQGVDYQFVTGSTNICDGNWHYVAGVYNGSSLTLYVDGVVDGTVSWANGPAYAPTHYIRIGATNSAGTDSNFFDGDLDAVALWGSALSASDIAGIADSSPSLSVSPSSSVSRSPSVSPSASSSRSPSSSASPSPSISTSPSPSPSPSSSFSPSPSPSSSQSPSSSVSPSPSPSGGLTTAFDGLIHTWVKSSDGFIYGFDNRGSIYRRDTDGVHHKIYTDSNGAIKGAAEWFIHNDTRAWLYWATDTALKRKPLPGLSNWNDVETVSSSLTSATWHTMAICEGALMIANGNTLAMVGYDASFTTEAVRLAPGDVATTVVERNGRTIAGTAKLSNPSRSVNAAIDSEFPLAQIGEDGEIYFANMSESMPARKFPGGGKVNPGGVCNLVESVNFYEWEQTALNYINKQAVGFLALWAVFDAEEGKGGIYSYGRKYKDHPFVLNLEYQFDADELGALTQIDGKALVSYKDGVDYGVKIVDLNTKAEGIYEGIDLKYPIKKIMQPTIADTAEIFMEPLADGEWIEFWYRIDKDGDFIRAVIASEEEKAQFNTIDAEYAVFRLNAEGKKVFEPRLVIHPTGNHSPEIHKIKINFH